MRPFGSCKAPEIRALHSGIPATHTTKVSRRRLSVAAFAKVFYPRGSGPNDQGAGRRHLLQELERQLKRLQTEWIDVYYLHRADFDTPLDETIATLNSCIQAGKIRYWGVSTFPAWKLAEAWWRAERRGWAPPVCEQSPYNILDRRIENERLPLYREYGIGLTTWSALAGGLLTGKYATDAMENPPAGSRIAERLARWRSRVSSDGFAKASAVAAIANEAGIDPIHFAIAWLLHQDGVTAPVIGPRNLEQLDSYMGALDVSLDREILNRVDAVVPPGSAVADFHDTSGWYVGVVPDLPGP